MEALTSALVEVGVRIHDRMVVHDNRWRSLDCDNPACCPPAGKPVPTPAEVSSVAAEFVGHEVAPHTLRADLVAQLEAGDGSGLVAEALTADCAADERRPDHQLGRKSLTQETAPALSRCGRQPWP